MNYSHLQLLATEAEALLPLNLLDEADLAISCASKLDDQSIFSNYAKVNFAKLAGCSLIYLLAKID
jgi:hypothetical protein